MTDEQDRDVTEVTFSFVAPVYNEAEVLPTFYAQLRDAADALGEPYEIIFVNDGSTDESLEIIRRLHEEDDRVKYVDLSRNFGHQEALTAGYDYAVGSAVVTLDADCQHPPDIIGELVARWRQGYEVVYTVKRSVAALPLWKRLISRAFYRFFAAISRLDVADQADFRLLDRKVVRVLRGLREQSRFLRGLVRWVGFRQIGVEYEVQPRAAGTPAYTVGKLARMAAAGLFNFSVLPLRAIGLTGAALVGAALVYAVAALALWPVLGASLTANLIMLAVGMLGVQLASLGLIGEYIGRMYDEAKGRPIYVVRDAVGFEPVEQPGPSPARAPSPQAAPAQEDQIRLFT